MEKCSVYDYEMAKTLLLFPSHEGDPKIYREARLPDNGEHIHEFIFVGGEGEGRKKREALFEYSQKGYLAIRFRLICIQSYGWMIQQWINSLHEKRTVGRLLTNVSEENKKPIYRPISPAEVFEENSSIVLKSEEIPAPEGVEPSEWDDLKTEVRQIYRNFLLDKEEISKEDDVKLDWEPHPYYQDKKRQREAYPLSWCPIDEWDSRDEMAIGKGTVEVCEHDVQCAEWEIQRTKECVNFLAKVPLECGMATRFTETAVNDTATTTNEEEFKPDDQCLADTKKRRLKMKKAKYTPEGISDWERKHFAAIGKLKKHDGEKLSDEIELKDGPISTSIEAIKKMLQRQKKPKS